MIHLPENIVSSSEVYTHISTVIREDQGFEFEASQQTRIPTGESLFEKLIKTDDMKLNTQLLSHTFDVKNYDLLAAKLKGHLLNSATGVPLYLKVELLDPDNREQAYEVELLLLMNNNKIFLVNLAREMPEKHAMHEVGIEKFLMSEINLPISGAVEIETVHVLAEPTYKQIEALETLSRKGSVDLLHSDFLLTSTTNRFKGLVYVVKNRELSSKSSAVTDKYSMNAKVYSIDPKQFLPLGIYAVDKNPNLVNQALREEILARNFDPVLPENVYENGETQNAFYRAALERFLW